MSTEEGGPESKAKNRYARSQWKVECWEDIIYIVGLEAKQGKITQTVRPDHHLSQALHTSAYHKICSCHLLGVTRQRLVVHGNNKI